MNHQRFTAVISRDIPSYSPPDADGDVIQQMKDMPANEENMRILEGLRKMGRTSPERTAVIQDLPSRPPFPGFLVESLSVQVIVYGACIPESHMRDVGTLSVLQEARDVMQDIQDVLLLFCPIQWERNKNGGELIDHWNGITASSGIIFGGYNSKNQPVWTQTYRIVCEPEETSRIFNNRDPL